MVLYWPIDNEIEIANEGMQLNMEIKGRHNLKKEELHDTLPPFRHDSSLSFLSRLEGTFLSTLLFCLLKEPNNPSN